MPLVYLDDFRILLDFVWPKIKVNDKHFFSQETTTKTNSIKKRKMFKVYIFVFIFISWLFF